VLNLAMAEIILDQPRIGSLTGKCETTSVTQHVEMGGKGQRGGGARYL
jgi:hypothetical protein